MTGALARPASFGGGIASSGGNPDGTSPHPLAPTVLRLADVPAVAVCEVAALAPRTGPLSAVRIRPAGDGRVMLETLSQAVAAAIEVDGEAARAVTIPAAALLSLRRRHPEAERLTIDDQSPLLRIRSLSEGAIVALACPEADPLPEIPLPEPTLLDRDGIRPPLLVDPLLLRQATEALRRMGCSPVRVTWVDDHPSIGLALEPLPVGELRGCVWICRCQWRSEP